MKLVLKCLLAVLLLPFVAALSLVLVVALLVSAPVFFYSYAIWMVDQLADSYA